MGKLTAIEVKSETKPGRYTDGDGLHLHVRPSGRKAWVFRHMRDGKLRDMGLGGYPDVSLAQARIKLHEARQVSRDGADPIEARRLAKGRKDKDRTFKAAAEHLIAAQKAGWSNEKHADQWTSTLAAYAYPVIGDLHVEDVTTEHVLRILQPIWSTKTETASRVRGRMEAVLDAARAMHWRQGENPARWKGHLASVLPKPSKVRVVEHHPSLPWQKLPAFLTLLRARTGSAARAIEFAILTAARSGEVRGVTRRELDLEARLWIVPKERMKAKRPHRVPLSVAALAFLDSMHVAEMTSDQLLFPSNSPRTPLSDMALTMVLRRMNAGAVGESSPWVDGSTGEQITVHGFRSTFRVWAGEQTEHPREVIEMALAHAVGDAVEAAYARTDLMERRRALMEDWGARRTG